jgi:hypothetical protein
LDLWPGTKITIYPTMTDFGGKRVECIRVKDVIPARGVEAPSGDDGIPF